MKNRKTPLLFLASLLLLITWTACNEDEEDMYTLGGAATGNQEVPAVVTNATGTLSGTLDTENRSLNYTINWTGLTGNVTVMHFHGPAPIGQSAPPIYDLSVTTNGTSGSSTGTITGIPDTTIQHFLNGRIYYNIHTGAHTAGEIRGQVTATR